MNDWDGLLSPSMAKTPAFAPSLWNPPRNRMAGRLLNPDPGPATQLRSPPNVADQFAQPFARSPQSPTSSNTFPTMSNAPQLDTHPALAPVLAGPATLTTHGAPSGVPVAACCHSWLVASR